MFMGEATCVFMMATLNFIFENIFFDSLAYNFGRKKANFHSKTKINFQSMFSVWLLNLFF
jgi:hypothetical protein